MNAWLRQHGQSLRHTAGRLRAAPFAALANVLVVGVVLALPLSAYLAVAHVQAITGSLRAEPQVSVFLAPGISKADSANLEMRLKNTTGVRSVRFVSRDTALANLKSAPGMGDVVATLRDNPLPDAYIATLRDEGDSAADTAEQLEQQLKALPGIAHVQADSAWVRRLGALLRVGRTVVLLLAGVLSLALVAVTFNTIRLQILTQREEIEVSKLMGATDAYVRRPFFYWGGFLGAAGGLAALLLVDLGRVLINRDLARFGDFYGVDLRLGFLSVEDALAFLVFATLLGVLGAYLSVSRHLSHIQPR
ncbi:MAG TPA: permease-like cell division protein FtsX [Burkholderiales bacterium]|nr:permease-like cell division protein FtsX [Burkholderiales bacterium]